MMLLLVLSITFGTAQVATNATRMAELEQELALRPREARVYLELAHEYERAGQSRRAEATLRTGLTTAWEVRRLRLATVDFLARSERWDDAVADAKPLAVDSAGRSLMGRLQVNAGLAAYRAGNRARARTAWEGALAYDSALVEGAVNLTAVLLELGKRDSARAVASRALRMHPNDSRLLSVRARTIDGSSGLAATVKALRQRRADHSGDEGAGLELASLLAASGNRMAAMTLYDTLARAPNASETALVAAVEFWMDGAQAKTAAVVADSALVRFPRSARLNALLGEAHAASSPPEWRRSADAYRRAIRYTREPEPLELALLDVYVSGDDTTRALLLATDMAARPASRLSLLQIAQRVALLRARALADSIYTDLLSRDAGDSEVLETAGALAESVGDTVKAIRLYQRGVALDSSGPASPLGVLRLTRASPDSSRLLLRRAVWRGMETLQNLELAGAAGATGNVTIRSARLARPNMERREQVLKLVRSALDTVVLHTSWGRTELAQLRLAYPYSALLERYVADVAAAGGSDTVALATYDRLLRRDAANPELQVERAALLDRMGRSAEAIDAYARALDLDPENERVFRTLGELRQRQGTLDALLEQVRRLRRRLPDSRVLGEHEIEVLQRLGRLTEAQRVANELTKRKP
jgi:tetratricopeptide (TPR) repeat protein